MHKYSPLHIDTSFGLEDNVIRCHLTYQQQQQQKILQKDQISPIATTLEFTYNIYAYV